MCVLAKGTRIPARGTDVADERNGRNGRYGRDGRKRKRKEERGSVRQGRGGMKR
jgi:hypothetical protein